MKLRLAREHYYSPDGGRSWKPKKIFNSVIHARKSGYAEFRWHVYICGTCNKHHVSKAKGK